MLAFVAIVLIVGFVQTRTEKAPIGSVPAASRSLFKPEPKALLGRTELNLTPKQSSGIAKVESEWESEKTTLLQTMSGYEPKRGRADQITSSLHDYSELSRAYDATRVKAWETACDLLDSRQKALVKGESK